MAALIEARRERRRIRRRKDRLPVQLALIVGVSALVVLVGAAKNASQAWSDGTLGEGGLSSLLGSRRRLQSSVPPPPLPPTAPVVLLPDDDDDGLRWKAPFTVDEMRRGAFLVPLVVLLYMFTGLAIVCDDYFVASLEEICIKLDISDDVAGATFMAAGGSAPEFFTSLLGVFFFDSDVGFGTIVGSASFNVLFVIGLCAYFSGYDILPLTWYPLARDCSYYLLSLAVLAAVTGDKKVKWWEAGLLILLYFGYVTIMYFDPKIRKWAMKNLDRSQAPPSANRVTPVVDATTPETPKSAEGASAGHAEAPVKQENSVASVTVQPTAEEEEEDTWPQWPETPKERVIFIINAPLNFLFAATIPNCAFEEKKKYYMATFWMSVMHIALLSYVMIVFAEDLGDFMGLNDVAMGVTILAAGTSIPDAVSSLLVAREGHGDMALSSSIGSNVFDVTFGLPVPWFIKTAFMNFNSGKPISISADGMGIQVGTLMGMVVIVVVTVHFYGWKISKPLGLVYFLLYFVFIAVALVAGCSFKHSLTGECDN